MSPGWGEGSRAGPQPHADAAETQRPAADLLSRGAQGRLGGQGWRRPQPSAPHRAGRPGRRSCSAVLCPCRPSEGHRSHRSHPGGDTPVLPLCGPRPAQHGVAGSEVARLASPRPESSQPAAASSPGAAGHGSVFAEERAEDRECRSHLGALGPSTGVPVCHRHTGTVILPPPGPSPVTLVTPQ